MVECNISRCPSGASGMSPEGRVRTLGSLPLALLLQAQSGTVAETASPSIVTLVLRSSPISKLVLLTLALLSVISWGIILYKLWTFRRSERHSAQFLDVFRRSSKFSEVQAVCKSLDDSPLVGLFQSGYAELTAQLRQASAPDGVVSSHPSGTVVRPTLKSLGAVDRALTRASAVEATNLGVVAPGIADALVATAAGLFAAIPAVYFYNGLSNRVKLFASEMDDFAMEFLNIAERNFT